MIYVYGVCEPGTAAPGVPGIGGAELRVADAGGVAAVYSSHERLRLSTSPELVLAHERVVEAMMAAGPVLPTRFGTRLDDTDRLTAVLAERRDGLLRGLARVRDRVELGVRVLPASRGDTEHGTDGRSGRAYLLARVAEHRREGEVTRDIHEPLSRLAVASVLRDPPAPPAVMVGAYLVATEREPEFSAQAHALAARHPDLQTHVTGPWPPYSFATEEQHCG